jgi:hypothetical protein
MTSTIVRSYKAKSQERAIKAFSRDAANLALEGYEPVSQSWGDGRGGCLRFILLGGIGALVFKPKGTLVVTYLQKQPRSPVVVL